MLVGQNGAYPPFPLVYLFQESGGAASPGYVGFFHRGRKPGIHGAKDTGFFANGKSDTLTFIFFQRVGGVRQRGR